MKVKGMARYFKIVSSVYMMRRCHIFASAQNQHGAKTSTHHVSCVIKHDGTDEVQERIDRVMSRSVPWYFFHELDFKEDDHGENFNFKKMV